MRVPAWKRFAVPAVVAAVAVTVMGGGSAAADFPQYPVGTSLNEGFLASLANPAAPPPGVNVPGCKPTAEHPHPVILVTGTFGNMIDDWSGLGPTLANGGYCVYSAPIGGDPHSVIQTTGPVVASAHQISALVDKVLADTGAGQVDLVGHSQGGLIAEYYAKFLGGAAKTHALVGLSPTTHGTTGGGLGRLAALFPGAAQLLGALCPACADQAVGSSVVAAVGTGPIAQPGVRYTIIETRNEKVVMPVGSAFIEEPGVQNLWVQDQCADDTIGHAGLPYDRTVAGLVENALDPAHPQPVGC